MPYHHTSNALSLPNKGYITPSLERYNKIGPREIDEWERINDNTNSFKRGMLDSTKKHTIGQRVTNAYEGMMNVKEFRELSFPFKSIKHAIAAAEIGFGISKEGKNLSSNAERFAQKYNNYYSNNPEKYKNSSYISGAGNAIRHGIWQGKLTTTYGAQVAKDAGDAHEKRPYEDLKVRVYDNVDDADMVVDLLNNKIGRRIGAMMEKGNTKDIALRVLEEYYRSGLYSCKEGENGKWHVGKLKLPFEIYVYLKREFEQSDEYGFSY